MSKSPAPKTIKQAREKAGRQAEMIAAGWLRLRGYKILEMRFKTPDGEIDIIARRKNVLACIEVKQRSKAAQAVDAVSYSSERRIMDAAEIFVARHPYLLNEDFELRFDILYVIGKPMPGLCKIEHFKDAFRAY